MSEKKKSLPAKGKIIIIESPEDKAEKAKLENTRNNAIASAYFSQAPTIPNIAKGAYYWVKGNILGGSENPTDYTVIGGEVPILGGPQKALVKNVVGKVLPRGLRLFNKGVNTGKYIGFKEGVELATKLAQKVAKQAAEQLLARVERAYKLGTLRGAAKAQKVAAEQLLARNVELSVELVITPNKNPGKLTKGWRWAKRHPWKSGLAVATLAYPTREYVIKPIGNYGGPIIGDAVTGIIAGEAPISIPFVANDSADLLYKGNLGLVKLSTPILSSNTPLSSDTIIGKPIDPNSITLNIKLAEELLGD